VAYLNWLKLFYGFVPFAIVSSLRIPESISLSTGGFPKLSETDASTSRSMAGISSCYRLASRPRFHPPIPPSGFVGYEPFRCTAPTSVSPPEGLEAPVDIHKQKMIDLIY